MEDIFPKEVRILTTPPTVALIASQAIRWDGVRQMAKWVKEHRPECLPEGYDPEDADDTDDPPELALFPHGGMRDPTKSHDYDNQLTDNELLVELAGRKCYDSFGLKAGQKTNAAYMANIMGGVDRTPEQIASGILDAHGDHLSPLLETQSKRPPTEAKSIRSIRPTTRRTHRASSVST